MSDDRHIDVKRVEELIRRGRDALERLHEHEKLGEPLRAEVAEALDELRSATLGDSLTPVVIQLSDGSRWLFWNEIESDFFIFRQVEAHE